MELEESRSEWKPGFVDWDFDGIFGEEQWAEEILIDDDEAMVYQPSKIKPAEEEEEAAAAAAARAKAIATAMEWRTEWKETAWDLELEEDVVFEEDPIPKDDKFFKELNAMMRAESETIVYWDIDSIPIPSDVDSFLVNLRRALDREGYTGPFFIHAYGDASKIPPSFSSSASSNATNPPRPQLLKIIHLPGEESRRRYYKSLCKIAFNWPANENLFLISDDDQQHPLLYQIKGPRLHTIMLVVSRAPANPAFFIAADHIWHWTELLVGGQPLSSDSVSDWLKPSTSSSLEKLPESFRRLLNVRDASVI